MGMGAVNDCLILVLVFDICYVWFQCLLQGHGIHHAVWDSQLEALYSLCVLANQHKWPFNIQTGFVACDLTDPEELVQRA